MRTFNGLFLAAGLATVCSFGVQAETPNAASPSGASAVAAGAAQPAEAVPPAPAGLPLAAFAVAGVRITWSNGASWDFPDGLDQAPPPQPRTQNYSLTLAGKFAEPATRIISSKVEKLVLDSGEDLLKQNSVDFYPALRQKYVDGQPQGGRVFTANLNLPSPSEKTTMIKELSGRIFYSTQKKSKIVNLGLTVFEDGAKGTVFDAKIAGIEEIPGGTAKRLKLTLSGPVELLANFKFYDEAGAAFKVQNGGWFVGEDSRTFFFNKAESFPAKGRIEVEVYDKHEATFKLENVPLFGRPEVNGFGAEAKKPPAPPSAVAAAAKSSARPVAAHPVANAALEGVFQPAPEGLGLVAMAVTGFGIIWFDPEEEEQAKVPQPEILGRRVADQRSLYNLHLTGKFAGPVFKILGAKLDKAVTDSGESLVGQNSGVFNWNLFQTWENGQPQPARLFQGSLSLAAPSAKAETIKELSGRVFYLVRGKSGRMVDVGLAEFKAGAKGTTLGARIKSITVQGNDGRVLSLTLDKMMEEVGEIKFYDAAGVALPVRPAGQLMDGNTPEFRFYSDEPLPAQGRIEVEVYDDLKKLVAPFRLENVPLYGRPVRPGA